MQNFLKVSLDLNEKFQKNVLMLFSVFLPLMPIKPTLRCDSQYLTSIRVVKFVLKALKLITEGWNFLSSGIIEEIFEKNIFFLRSLYV